jgi:hypothetical protein
VPPRKAAEAPTSRAQSKTSDRERQLTKLINRANELLANSQLGDSHWGHAFLTAPEEANAEVPCEKLD